VRRADHSSGGVLLSVMCECDSEASIMRPLTPTGSCAMGEKKCVAHMV
jgi:hypothetical protein